MPRRETRFSIERALDRELRKHRLARFDARREKAAAIVRHLAKMRDLLDPESFAKVQSQYRTAAADRY